MRHVCRCFVLILCPLMMRGIAQESVYEREGWPGEGIPVLIASVDVLRLRTEPDLRTPARTIPYQRGWLIPFDKTVVRTLEVRELLTVSAATLDIWCDGVGVEDIALSVGEPWTYLQYRAEGRVMARIQGKLCEVPALLREEIFGENIPEPVVQWWVEVLYEDGSSPGWLLVGDEQIDFGRRRF